MQLGKMDELATKMSKCSKAIPQTIHLTDWTQFEQAKGWSAIFSRNLIRFELNLSKVYSTNCDTNDVATRLLLQKSKQNS